MYQTGGPLPAPSMIEAGIYIPAGKIITGTPNCFSNGIDKTRSGSHPACLILEAVETIVIGWPQFF